MVRRNRIGASQRKLCLRAKLTNDAVIEVVVRGMRLGHRQLIVRDFVARVRRVKRVIARRDGVHPMSGQRHKPIADEREARGPSSHSGISSVIHGASHGVTLGLLLQLLCKSMLIVVSRQSVVKCSGLFGLCFLLFGLGLFVPRPKTEDLLRPCPAPPRRVTMTH